MHRLRQIKAYALGEIVDKDTLVSELEESYVPISSADCRGCPDPCDEDHEPYPSRFDVDMESKLLGTVKPYRRQVVISTGKSDWEREITDAKGTLAAYLSEVQSSNSSTKSAISVKAKSTVSDDAPKLAKPIPGVFRSGDSSRISILNGSHRTICDDDTEETVLVFPDYTLMTGVSRSIEGAHNLWNLAVDPAVERTGPAAPETYPGVETWIIPYSCVILICSHKKRDNRCAIAAPKLGKAFTHSLERKGWEVHSQLEHTSAFGPPLEKFEGTPSAKEEHVLETLKKLPDSKRALVLMCSHVGGHKYVGNLIIYVPQGSGIWYGRVTTHEVESIVDNTIIEGKVLPPLLRAGLNISRPGCHSLNDW